MIEKHRTASSRGAEPVERRADPVSKRGRTLLEPGHEAEWAEINREEAEQLRTSNMALSAVQRLELGQKLSAQAVELLNISVQAGHAPRRAYGA